MQFIEKKTVFALFAAFFWAVTILITRFLIKNGENNYNVIFWATIITTPYWVFVLFKKRSEFRPASKSSWLIIILIALISGCVIPIIESVALKYSSAVNFSFLIRTVIPFTIILAFIFLRERIGLSKIVLVGVILLGAYLLSTGGKGLEFSKGDILIVIEALLIALSNNVLTKHVTKKFEISLIAPLIYIIGFCPIILTTIVLGNIDFPDLNALALIIALSFITILLHTSRMLALKLGSASSVTMLFSLTPVIVALLSIPILSESLSLLELFGGFIIIFAGILVVRIKD